jgi:hypothetical protein
MQTLSGFMPPVQMESVSAVTATPSVSLGETRFQNGETYIYAYNAGTGDLSIGNLACLSANSGFSVSVSSITMFDLPIGFVKHATIAAGSYGWLLTRGFTKVMVCSNTSAALSDIVYAGGQGSVATLTNNSALTALQLSGYCAVCWHPIGQILSAAATAGASTRNSALAFVSCFGV